MKHIAFIAFLILSNSAISQYRAPIAGGEFVMGSSECISQEQRDAVNAIIEENIKKYNLKRGTDKSMMVLYDWPVAQNPAFDYNSSFAISNYVDHDPNFPNSLEDYNCGTHTYDTNSGYNHQGIDIYLWPFDHNQVDADQTWVVAAADGTIFAKHDGEVDDHCAFNNDLANYVILEHSDGSRSWYWHMKLNSVTSKAVGASVVAGEYLGVVASSGNSTGPHLHFECYDDNLVLVDPYDGTCNSMNNGTTFWNSQKPYWEPTINTLLTHSALPSFQACPNLDITNIKTSFVPGETVFCGAYYHDQQTTSTTTYEILRPDNSTFSTWMHTSPGDYRSSSWFWSTVLPGNAQAGTWKWQATLDGFTVTREFTVEACPPSYSDANGNALTGVQSTNADYETDGIIESDQIITGAGTTVDYDSGTYIELKMGFETLLGSIFHAFIDGCGGAMAKEESDSSDNK